MGATAAALGFIGSIIAVPVTGGASVATAAASASAFSVSLGTAATAVGFAAGAGATGVRSAVGKPCLSPAVPAIQKATGVINGVTGVGTGLTSALAKKGAIKIGENVAKASIF